MDLWVVLNSFMAEFKVALSYEERVLRKHWKLFSSHKDHTPKFCILYLAPSSMSLAMNSLKMQKLNTKISDLHDNHLL